MVFLNSPLFWLGLTAAAIAVPIVIHLLSRYKSHPLEWAAMELLRRAMIVRARRLRMEDWILLLLRCLALLLAGLAFARPAIKPSGTSWLGGGGKAGVVIALDASFSMDYKPGLRSRFDLARERAADVLSTLSPGDPVTLLLLGNRPRVLLRNAAYDADRVGALLKAASPLQESLNLDLCLEEMERLVAEMRAPSRECFLITDAQASTWKKVSDGARATMRKISQSATLFVVPVGAADAENLAVTRFALASGVLRKGTSARYVADVYNSGRTPRAGVTVQLFLNETAVDQRVIEKIGPGQTESVSLFALLDKAGTSTLSARIDKDALPLDNARYAVVDVGSSVSVLCVDGSPSTEPFQGATDFLVAALIPDEREISANAVPPLRVDRVRADDLQIGKLSSYDIVMLANVPEIVREQAFALGDFVRRGKGLVVFLGDKTNPDMMNDRMRDAAGNSLLAAKLLRPDAAKAKKEQPLSLAPKIPDHPVTRVFRTMPQTEWARIQFASHVAVAPERDARVLLRLSPGDDPLLIERAFGRGNVLLFTSSADCKWTDLPTHPAYLMLVQQIVTHLTRKPHEKPVTVSEPLSFDLPSDVTAAAVKMLNPRGEESNLRLTNVDGNKAAVLQAADYAGVYEARYGQDVPPMKAAANLDPAESDITVLRGRELSSALSRLPVRLLNEGQDAKTAARESRYGRELWRLLLWLAFAVLVVEAALARRFVRRTEETA